MCSSSCPSSAGFGVSPCVCLVQWVWKLLQKLLISNTASGKEAHFKTSLWPDHIPGAFRARRYDCQGHSGINHQPDLTHTCRTTAVGARWHKGHSTSPASRGLHGLRMTPGPPDFPQGSVPARTQSSSTATWQETFETPWRTE